jgi:hypothetical protein
MFVQKQIIKQFTVRINITIQFVRMRRNYIATAICFQQIAVSTKDRKKIVFPDTEIFLSVLKKRLTLHSIRIYWFNSYILKYNEK